MQNKWSKYIDQDFSFSNEVNYNQHNLESEIGKLKSNNLTLEPRLQEYIKKKKYYIDNRIDPDVPLERQYNITSSDITIIKKFMNGNKKVYETKTYNKIMDKEICRDRQSFPSKQFRDKEQKNFGYVNTFDPKAQFTKPENHGMFVPEDGERHYVKDIINKKKDEIRDPRDLSSTLSNYDTRKKKFGFSLNDTRFDPRIDKKVTEIPGNVEKYNKYSSQYRIDQVPDCSINDNINNKTFDNNKIKRKLDLQQGIPARTSKSYGYSDVQEHSFQYLDEKCQNPDDSSLIRSGESTRLNNKQMNRKYSRQVN